MDRPGQAATLDAPESGSRPGVSLGRQTIAAAHWRFASSAIQGVLQLGIGVLLARRLLPSDFGVIGLAAVVVGFATLAADLGLGPALIQRQPLTDRHIRIGFTVSTLLGCALALLVFATAGFWARLMEASALGPVLRVEALLFVFVGVGTAALALLRRSLQFRKLFAIEASSYVIGYAFVAVAMAYRGFGVWSLVWGALVQRFLASGLAVLWVRHPIRPLLARKELREMLGFGLVVSLNQLVNYAARNGDNAVVGRWLGPASLGLYARAFNVMAVPLGQVDALMWNVLFPALSRIQREAARFRQAYLLGVQVTCLTAVPLMATLAVAAPHLIVSLYGVRWAGTVAPFQVLCFAGPFRVVSSVAGTVAHASGRVHAELARQLGYALLVITGSVVGLPYGITGVAVGVTAAVVIMYLWMGQLSVRISGCAWRDFITAQVPGWLLGMGVGLCGLAVRLALEAWGAPSPWILAGLMLVCAAAIPLGLYLLPRDARLEELFTRLGRAAAGLPPVVRNGVLRVLRTPG